MQRLIALKVPWQISPKSSCLTLSASESEDQPTEVMFIANFGLRSQKPASEDPRFSSERHSRNPQEIPREGEKREAHAHSLVTIQFEDGLRARISPLFSSREVLNPQEFDFSAVTYSNPPGDLGTWLEDFQNLWMGSGDCPDPGAYEVESSKWIEQLSLEDFRHFLIAGRGAYVEVLARGWKWIEIKSLPNF